MGGSHEPLGVSREAFPSAFGSSSRRYGSAGSGGYRNAANESKERVRKAEPSGEQGGMVQGVDAQTGSGSKPLSESGAKGKWSFCMLCFGFVHACT